MVMVVHDIPAWNLETGRFYFTQLGGTGEFHDMFLRDDLGHVRLFCSAGDARRAGEIHWGTEDYIYVREGIVE